jgi:hypothetical protein
VSGLGLARSTQATGLIRFDEPAPPTL